MARRAVNLGVLAMVFAGLVTACTTASGPEATEGSASADPISVSRTSNAAPADFRGRPKVPSCGDVTLGQGEQIPQDALNCLAAAFNTGAELAVSRPTTEGDPIISFYRVTPDIAGVEIFTDLSNDRFGSGGWTHDLCPGLNPVAAVQGCVEQY